MDLHGKIMNLPGAGGLSEIGTTQGEQLAYKRGHRDARHAAAELALNTDAAMEEAAKIIQELCECYGHPIPDATIARLLGDA